MKNNSPRMKHVFLFIMLLMSMFGSISEVFGENPTERNLVALIDENHGQFLGSEQLTKAIEKLHALGFEVLSTGNNSITSELLTSNGIDLLIIPNPGAISEAFKFKDLEKELVSQWLDTGSKGIIALTNPELSENNSLSGHPEIINLLLNTNPIGILETTATFQTAIDLELSGTDNVITINRLTDDLNSTSYLTLTADPLLLNASSEKEESDATPWTIKTQASSVLAPVSFITAGLEAFGVSRDKKLVLQGKDPIIAGGFEMSSGSRIVFVGSTLMFSDLPNPDEENTAWFDLEDNSEFFAGLVGWSLVLSDIGNMSTEPEEFYWIWLPYGLPVFTAIFVIAGLFLHRFGKNIEIFQFHESEITKDRRTTAGSPDVDDDKSQTKLTRGQKRLQQRQKGKKGSSRRN